MFLRNQVLTSESVGEGHPDKVCDLISDAILDACLKGDPNSRVACEVLATTNTVIVGGEITTNAIIDIDSIVRDTVKQIGYTIEGIGFDASTLTVTNLIDRQSADIALGVDRNGAGDQGMMFGYATKETPTLMPAPIYWAHELLKQAALVRRKTSFLRPDAKGQISLAYRHGRPHHIDAVVLSHQHSEEIAHEDLVTFLKEEIIIPTLEPSGLFDGNTKLYINPTGRFVIGGPAGDTGLTGRKIIVDTYGGIGHHGGGSFSGKDPSKVDRSGAYLARWIATNLVRSGLCSTCEIQLSYAIGVAEPISIVVETFGTGVMSEAELIAIIRNNFDLTPKGMIEALDLRTPIYTRTTNYGHFGKPDLPWEQKRILSSC